jgi:hypothetical protein
MNWWKFMLLSFYSLPSVPELTDSFLHLELDYSDVWASRLDRFTTDKTAVGRLWIGDCVGHKDGVDVVGKRKYIAPPWNGNPIFCLPTRSLVHCMRYASSVPRERLYMICTD